MSFYKNIKWLITQKHPYANIMQRDVLTYNRKFIPLLYENIISEKEKNQKYIPCFQFPLYSAALKLMLVPVLALSRAASNISTTIKLFSNDDKSYALTFTSPLITAAK